MREIEIEPVPPGKLREAAQFLVSGVRRDAMTRAQAEALSRGTIERHPQRCELFWARRAGRCLAAAMIFHNVGRTGLLVASPANAEGVDRQALTQLVGTVSRQAIAQGLSMVQSLLKPHRGEDIAALRQAGFILLAELIYMRLPIRGENAPPPGGGLTWLHYGQFSEQDLADVIAATYRQSLDCPALEGVRQIGDIIAGHKATGVFNAESWWIVQREGRPAGCILVNESPATNSFDVVYMGVAPEHRRKGLAKAMLQKAAAYAASRQSLALTLAVDASNTPAMRLYESFGFEPVDRRVAMAMTRGKKDASTLVR